MELKLTTYSSLVFCNSNFWIFILSLQVLLEWLVALKKAVEIELYWMRLIDRINTGKRLYVCGKAISACVPG